MEISNILKELTGIPSPSGFENAIRAVIKKMVAPYVDTVVEDVFGNLICKKNAKVPATAKTIMFIAHMDEVGLMVTYIEDSGMIRFGKIGGVDVCIMKGKPVQITHNNSVVQGVIGVRPAHMKKESEQRDFDFSDLWIDIGVKNKDEASKYVSIGDCAVIQSDLIEMPNNLISCRGCDDKAGVASLIKMLEKIEKKDVAYNIVVVMSAQEEIGLRGAKISSYNINPDICIAIDVAHATDYQTINKAKYGDVKLGDGPVIPYGADFSQSIQEKLRDISKSIDINHQIIALPSSSGTDVNAAITTKGGCLSGLVSIPCRYMHTPIEVVSIKDIETVSNLLSAYCTSLYVNHE